MKRAEEVEKKGTILGPLGPLKLVKILTSTVLYLVVVYFVQLLWPVWL